jgi:antitoxin component YwqK of YwqJK toxin-antitoxin module
VDTSRWYFQDGESIKKITQYQNTKKIFTTEKYNNGENKKIISYFGNGNKMSDLNYNENGSLHGYAKYWYKDGSLSQTIYMDDGELVDEKSSSEMVLFAPSGAKKSVSKFSDGRIKEVLFKKKDKCYGSRLLFHDGTGLKRAEMSYKPLDRQSSCTNHTLNGVFTEWHDNGVKKYEGSYKTYKTAIHNVYPNRPPLTYGGHAAGTHIWWNKIGIVEKVANYKNNKIHGLVSYFYLNSNKKAELKYNSKYSKNRSGVNASLDGITTYWFENGDKKYEGKYKVHSSPYITDSYPHKRPWYYGGNPIKEHTWWNNNGSVREVKDYKRGK